MSDQLFQGEQQSIEGTTREAVVVLMRDFRVAVRLLLLVDPLSRAASPQPSSLHYKTHQTRFGSVCALLFFRFLSPKSTKISAGMQVGRWVTHSPTLADYNRHHHHCIFFIRMFQSPCSESFSTVAAFAPVRGAFPGSLVVPPQPHHRLLSCRPTMELGCCRRQ